MCFISFLFFFDFSGRRRRGRRRTVHIEHLLYQRRPVHRIRREAVRARRRRREHRGQRDGPCVDGAGTIGAVLARVEGRGTVHGGGLNSTSWSCVLEGGGEGGVHVVGT